MEAREEEDVPGRFAGDESQLEWCSQSGQRSESVEKPRIPVLQHEWEDAVLSKSVWMTRLVGG